jgi:hypothetical protein
LSRKKKGSGLHHRPFFMAQKETTECSGKFEQLIRGILLVDGWMGYLVNIQAAHPMLAPKTSKNTISTMPHRATIKAP